MTLDEKADCYRKKDEDRKQVVYLDTWPKKLAFVLGTAISGADPEFGKYCSLKIARLIDRTKRPAKSCGSKRKRYSVNHQDVQGSSKKETDAYLILRY